MYTLFSVSVFTNSCLYLCFLGQLIPKYSKRYEDYFIIKPYIRFEGEPGEQATMFFKDPSGNALEFKSFKDSSQIFAK